MTETTSAGSIYLCVKQFNARLGDELNLKIGDKVEVLADDSEYNDGWYMGRNLLNNDVGLYPKTFTQLLHSPKNPDSLLRSRSRRVNSPGGQHKNGSSPSINKMTDYFNDLSVNGNSNSNSNISSSTINNGNDHNDSINKSTDFANTSTSTMNDIDKALKELQESPISSNKSKINSSGIPSFLNGSSTSFSNVKGNGNGNVNGGMKPSRDSLNDGPDVTQAFDWSSEQVTTYFGKVLGFDHLIAEKFSKHKITGAILFELDLAHLKELEIDSFGTRFEIYKEIENLRKINGVSTTNTTATVTPQSASTPILSGVLPPPVIAYPYGSSNSSGSKSNISGMEDTFSKSTSQLMPSALLSRSNSRGDVYIKEHQRKRSQSLDNISKQTPKSGDARSPSVTTPHQQYAVNDVSTPSKEDKRRSMAFVSPRKAPVPPTQASPINKQYKFGGPGIGNEDSVSIGGHLYVTRSNAAGLGISGFSRPASSIYDNSIISHSRKESQTSQSGGAGLGHHRRNSSTISGAGAGHHRRHSSLFLFLSTNEDLTLTGEKGTPKQLSTQQQQQQQQQQNQQLQNGTTPINQINNRHSTFHPDDGGDYFKSKNITNNALISPAYIKPETPTTSTTKTADFSPNDEPIDIDKASLSPRKLKSVSYRPLENRSSSSQLPKSSAGQGINSLGALDEEKRAASDSKAPSRLKTLRTTSTQNFKNLTTLKKLKTSAFQEGIRQITPDDAIKTSNFSGWMSKKSGLNIGWRSRYFTLHGTRLLYFTSLKDKRERGLIDITAHKVIPINTEDAANSNDKYVAMYASSTGYGRYCFKIVPPAPGFKKGLTFTQPKTHYFAVETQEDMRSWLKALMTATIDIDDTVPVVSSCNTPTVTLSKAQELLARAREETKLKDEELRAQGYLRDGYETYDPKQQQLQPHFGQEEQIFTSEENSPIVNEHMLERAETTRRKSNLNSQPSLSLDTSTRIVSQLSTSKTPTTPQFSNQGGFASPYLLASGLLSPKSGNSSSVRDSTDTRESLGLGIEREGSYKDRLNNIPPTIQSGNTSSSNITQSPASSPGNRTTLDFLPTGETTPKLIFLNSNGRMVSGSKKKINEKLIAYSNDGSGNHSFSIKKK